MIVVFNQEHGQIYGFANLEAYKEFAKRANWRDCWDNQIYDVGDGGEATDDNLLDLYSFHLELSRMKQTPLT